MVLLRWGLEAIYPYTLRHLDRRIERRNEESLLRDVGDSLGFMFGEYDAKVVPNEANRLQPGFDYAQVLISVGCLRLQIIRCRGELGVMIAPDFAPHDWHELSLLLAVCVNPNSIVRTSFIDLWDLAARIRPHFPCILKWCQFGQFTELKKMLEGEVYRNDRIVMRVTQTEINRNLYRE